MLRLAALLVAMSVFLVAGCAHAQQAPNAGPEASQPKPGGTLNMRLRKDPIHWDVTYGAAGNNAGVALAYETLLTYKAGPDVAYNDGVLVPSLAERWEVSPDACTFTFHLRRGVKFAPLPGADGVNGRELSAADVKWSFEYAARVGEFKHLPRTEVALLFERLDQIDAPDQSTVAVRFKEPFVPFPYYVGASGASVIMPREIFRADGHLKDRMVGTGPYQLAPDASLKGSRWVFEKNQAYRRAGRPYVDRVRFVVLEDQGAVQAAFAARQVDFLDANVTISERNQLEQMARDAVYYEYELPWAFYVNQTEPPFDDIRVRQALSMSIDRDELVRLFNRGWGRHHLPGVSGDYFSPEEVKALQPYDVDRAGQLLREAGYGKGVEVEMVYPGPEYGLDYVSLLQLMQTQVRKAGFEVQLKRVDGMGRNLRARNYALAILPGGFWRWDVDLSLADWYPGAGSNYHGVNDPALAAYIDAQRAAGEPGRRREIIRELVRYLMQHQYGIGLFGQVRYKVWHPYVKDLHPNRNLAVPPLADAWLDR